MSVGKVPAARTEIPWQDEGSWQELQLAIAAICSGLAGKETEVRKLARALHLGYQQLEQPMDQLCSRSCPSCQEVCCVRATLWYDLPDLLFIYLISAELPGGQIFRQPGGACCQLGTAGCVLPRWQRPFICSWYLCASQQTILQGLPEPAGIQATVERLRSLRKQLYRACVEAVSP